MLNMIEWTVRKIAEFVILAVFVAGIRQLVRLCVPKTRESAQASLKKGAKVVKKEATGLVEDVSAVVLAVKKALKDRADKKKKDQEPTEESAD